MDTAVHTQNRFNEFVRLQLAVDVLVDLPDDVAGGPSGPHDTYFGFGMRWWVLICSGVNFAAVSETTRRTILPDVDPELTLEECITGMAEILQQLERLDGDEYAKTVDGMLRARRYVRGRSANQEAERRSGTNPVGPPRTRAMRRKQRLRGEERPPADAQADMGTTDGLVLTETQYRFQVHLAESAIDALRAEPPGSSPDFEPGGQDARLVGIGEAYSVWHHLALAYMVGGARGLARARDIFDPHPPMSPMQAIGGLQDVRRRLEALNAEDRLTAFAAIDFCLQWFDPVEK